jgi:hypothetical protein
MTPEELARAAGEHPSAYYGGADSLDAIRKKVLAGELPPEALLRGRATTIRPGATAADVFERFMNSMGGFGQRAKEEALKPGGVFKTADTPTSPSRYRQAAGGKSSAALGALGTFMEDPVAGAFSAPIGIGAGQLANIATTAATAGMMSGPPALKAAGMALRYLVPATVGYQAQQATARGVQQLTGSAPQAVAGAVASGGGGGGLFGLGSAMQDSYLDVPILGRINIGERAKSEAAAAYQRKERQKDFDASLAEQTRLRTLNQTSDLAYQRELAQITNEAQNNQMKSRFPFLLNLQREEANIQKTLLNLQTANMQSLARMAGGVQLLDRGMAEQGALSRTLAANSPYNSMVLPMPQIQFG